MKKLDAIISFQLINIFEIMKDTSGIQNKFSNKTNKVDIKFFIILKMGDNYAKGDGEFWHF